VLEVGKRELANFEAFVIGEAEVDELREGKLTDDTIEIDVAKKRVVISKQRTRTSSHQNGSKLKRNFRKLTCTSENLHRAVRPVDEDLLKPCSFPYESFEFPAEIVGVVEVNR